MILNIESFLTWVCKYTHISRVDVYLRMPGTNKAATPKDYPTMMDKTVKKIQKLWSGLRRTGSNIYLCHRTKVTKIFVSQPWSINLKLLQDVAKLSTFEQESLGPGAQGCYEAFSW